MTVILTIKEISTHLLNELFRADTDFQIQQRNMAVRLKKEVNLVPTPSRDISADQTTGLGNLNPLFLEQADFSFKIEQVRENFWLKIRRFFSPSLPKPNHLYRFIRGGQGNNKTANSIDVKITIKRSFCGSYEEVIDSTSNIHKKPNEVYVSGFT